MRLTAPWLLIVAGLIGPICGVARAEPPVRFNRDIRPILSENCYQCHGPDAHARKADLRLDTEEGALANLGGYFSIVPGKPGDSEVVRRISTPDDDEDHMPPAETGKHLTPQQIDLIRRWVRQGAPWQAHWAFIAPQRPALPKTRRDGWGRNPIDAFVLAKLEANGLEPSPEADKATLIRRVSFDLTGLPPTPDQVDAFLADDSPNAYAKVVDRLLKSPRYGEHMARHWLDGARYADTNGYQYDTERTMWPWRDWVILAYNENKPFDQFTVEQIAGDLLPDATTRQRIATGFNRNHPITIEGGVIDEEYRTEYVIDRVQTTTTVWMGLTVGCARCHDHKFDPITQREFYRFFAFFNQVPERGANGFDPTMCAPSPEQEQRLTELNEQIAQAQAVYDELLDAVATQQAGWESHVMVRTGEDWEPFAPEQVASAGGTTLTVLKDYSVLASGQAPDRDTYDLVLRTDETRIKAIRLEVIVDGTLPRQGAALSDDASFVLSEFELLVAPTAEPDKAQPVKFIGTFADRAETGYEIDKAVDGRADTGWGVDGQANPGNRVAIFAPEQPIGFDGGSVLRFRLRQEHGNRHQIGRFRISLTTNRYLVLPTNLAEALALPLEQRSGLQRRLVRDFYADTEAPEPIKRQRAQLVELREQYNQRLGSLPTLLVMADLSEPRDTFFLNRGQYDQLGEKVTAGTPAALPPIPPDAPLNRLGLARWMVDPAHPLTARVAVNRYWQRCFGTGIVKTAEDFGTQGQWPSHPDLLDWLAVEFVESGWDVKHMQRLIMTSATYRQSSSVTPGLWERDPENRLLARGPRLRLDAEVIRDNALAVGGLLVEKVGGPSVYPYQPPGLWMELNNRKGYSRQYPVVSGEDLYRRSMYTFWKRTVPAPPMLTFDAPEREYCVVRRSRTNTPLQALVLLHDPQFVEAARHLAQRMMAEADGPDGRIAAGFRLATARRPSGAELAVFRRVYRQQLAEFRADPSGAEQLLSIGKSQRDESLDPTEHAAWTAVARIILNLDETITKD